jgi:hypothetical protein
MLDHSPSRDREKEMKNNNQAATKASFRIKVKQIMFFKRMIAYFFEYNLIPEPTLSHLARACLNIMAQKYSRYEDSTMGNYLPPNLRRPPPIDRIEEPEWM